MCIRDRDLGIIGAALGTCSGMILCALIAFFAFTRGKMQLRFCRPDVYKRQGEENSMTHPARECKLGASASIHWRAASADASRARVQVGSPAHAIALA